MSGYGPQQELLDRLERVRVLLAHAFEIRRAIGRDGDGHRRALERFLFDNVEPAMVPRSEAVRGALADIDRRIEERSDPEAPFPRLIAALGLGEVETDLLLAALAPGVRRGFREAMTILGPEAAPGVHPAAHLIELCGGSVQGCARARAALDDGGVLVGSGALLALDASPLSPPTWRAVAPSLELRCWLEGRPSPHSLLDESPEVRRLVEDPVADTLQHLAAGEGPVRVVLVGPPGAGRTRAAAALAHIMGRRGARIPAEVERLRPALLDALLRRHLAVLRLDIEPLEPGALALLDTAGPCAVLSPPAAPAVADLQRRGFVRVDVDPPGVSVQVRAWRSLLGDTMGDDALAELVRGHSLELGAIEEAAARAGSRGDRRAVAAAAEEAARAVTGERLSKIADRLSTTLTWDDLVLPDEVRAGVDEIWRAAAARRRVFEEWGFDERTPYGRAISALFTGEPGTGKTMVATIIARALGLELYRVDLSRLVDKYIGETEKHLATLFAEAERGRCVLLFDEADAIFGKRTRGGDSAVERYANLEVNYLLQRIETFSGIVLLTTNQESIIDEAFKRRIRYRIEFPFPEPADRAHLWRRLIAPEAPVADDVDPELLARRYELSGGHIKNAVLRAALAAAAADGPIDQARLVHAANQELENIGKLVFS